MKVQKVVLVALVALFSIGLTSCTKTSAEDDQLYDEIAIEKGEIKDQDVD